MIRLSSGPTPTSADLQRAKARAALISTELSRVRAAALAWRQGLGGLLVALVGFSLIKGRSDIGQLSHGWAVAVGALLLGAVITGACGALALLRAAHGKPKVVDLADIPPAAVLDHQEALSAAAALRTGIILTLACAALLVAAVATTWYGPARTASAMQTHAMDSHWEHTMSL